MYGASEVNLEGTVVEGNSVLADPQSNPACKPSDPCGGGGLFLTGQTMAQVGPAVTLAGNAATRGDGGAILVLENAVMTASDCTLANNSALRGGGAAVLGSAELNAISSLFFGNSAGSEGGAIFSSSEGRNLSMASVTFDSNSAVKRGGGLSLFSSSLLRSTVRFRENAAGLQGGAIFASGYAAQIFVGADSSVELSRNVATSNGGGAALVDGGGFVIEFDACPSKCTATMRGNGQCNIEW